MLERRGARRLTSDQTAMVDEAYLAAFRLAPAVAMSHATTAMQRSVRPRDWVACGAITGGYMNELM